MCPGAHPACACVQTRLFILHVYACVPFASICHFVQIISKGMGPNAAIHTSIRATQATMSERGGWGEKGGGRGGGRGIRCRTRGQGEERNVIWFDKYINTSGYF